MKYIRTKDGRIIPILDEDRETKLPKRDLRFYYIKPNNVIAYIGKDEIVNQADTIEELCDEFVCEKHLATGFRFKGAVPYFRILKMTGDIYGAIWTDKGLIYVAKMNDEGELELL